jgi:hypothetical protein
MSARLTSSVLVGALIRRAESQGGFAAVLAKGDPGAGAVLVLLTKGGRKLRILERLMQGDGHYYWQDSSAQAIGNEEEIDKVIERRRKYDPDLWLVELDIPSPERFAAEMNA